MASSPPIFELFSEDPEIVALQAMIKGLRHFSHSKKDLTMRHFKLVCAVELCLKLLKRPATVVDIEMFTQVTADQFRVELNELVELRYLHESVPTFGKPTPTYKLGATGGTAIRTMFKHLQPRATANDV